ncbi:hypothetical protein WBG78_04225 [Chryseolinea sp. T2]|uniref:hypothetical protein n=1 Tax=Chryseolinea sp. T2 TaxID=3129255 RepID=UPI0030778692
MNNKRFVVSAITRLVVAWLLLVVVLPSVNAQQPVDVVIMSNGEKKEGKVVAVNQTTIKFKYKGEDLEYELNKSDIDKIQFASRRTEVFKGPDAGAATTAATAMTSTSAADRKGKIAVIPFDLNTNDPGIGPEKMSQQIQADCITAMRKYTHGLTVVDPQTVNALLAQHNVTSAQLTTTAPKDLALMLGVQYVVVGRAEIMNKGTQSYGSGVSTYKDKDSQNKDGDKKNSKSSGTAVSSSSSTTVIEYGTKVAMDIYDDEGNSVFSQKRDTFGSTIDAYIGSLDYMSKRTPFGSKAK